VSREGRGSEPAPAPRPGRDGPAPTRSRSTFGLSRRWRTSRRLIFSRCYRVVFGETPHRLPAFARRGGARDVPAAGDQIAASPTCASMSASPSLGTFSRTFREIVGETAVELTAAVMGRSPSRTAPRWRIPGRGATQRFWISHHRAIRLAWWVSIHRARRPGMITKLNVMSIYRSSTRTRPLDFLRQPARIRERQRRPAGLVSLADRCTGFPGDGGYPRSAWSSPGPAAARRSDDAEQLRELLTKGALNGPVLITRRCPRAIRDAQNAWLHRLHPGAHRPLLRHRTWASRDPFGHPIRILQQSACTKLRQYPPEPTFVLRHVGLSSLPEN